MKQPEVIQLAVTRIITWIITCSDPSQYYSDLMSDAIEKAYEELKERAKSKKLALVGVNQTIQTTLGGNFFVFTVVLVGSAVDAEAVAMQQRLQQFDPRAGLKH